MDHGGWSVSTTTILMVFWQRKHGIKSLSVTRVVMKVKGECHNRDTVPALTPMDDDYQPLPHLLVEGEVRGVSRCSVMKNIWHQVTMTNTIRLSFLYIFVPFWIFISSISSTSNKSNDRCWCSTTPLPPRVKFRHFLLGEVQVEIQVCPLEVARDRLEVMFWGLVSISKEVSNRRSTRKNTEQTLHL